jgi:predicted CoA-binding protein
MLRESATKNHLNWSNPRLMREILEGGRTIAIVGISENPLRPSHEIARYLIENGYHVVGVNPAIEEFLGALCYPSLAEIPEPVDVVNVFRKPEAVEALVTEVIKLEIPYLWLQEGVVDQEAALRAKEAGVKVIMDQCIKKEHMKINLKKI